MVKTLNRIALVAAAMVGTAAVAQDAAPANTTDNNAPTRYASESPVAPSDRTDQGWNREWSLNFSLINPFNGSGFLTNFQGFVSGDYYLSEDTAIRAGVNLTRNSNAVSLTKTTVTTGPGAPLVTYSVGIPGNTETYGVTARGEYLKRLSNHAVAPYLGGGLSLGWNWSRLNFTDDVSVVDQTTKYNNSSASFNVGAVGVAGAEWRVHPHFALFAEYGLQLTLFTWSSSRGETTVENRVGGGEPSTSQSVTESVSRTWLNLSTGLTQGATLGLRVMF